MPFMDRPGSGGFISTQNERSTSEQKDTMLTDVAKVGTVVGVGAGLMFAPLATLGVMTVGGGGALMADPEGAEAAFRTENTVGSFMADQSGKYGGALSEEYDPFDDVAGTEFQPHWERFSYSKSPEHTELIKQDIIREGKDREYLQSQGWLGQVQSMAAGLFDLPSLLPGGAAVRTAKGVSKLRTALKVGGYGMAGASISEAALHASQELRTREESQMNIAGATILSGVLGYGMGSRMARSELDALGKRVEQDFTPPDKSKPTPSTEPQTSIPREMDALETELRRVHELINPHDDSVALELQDELIRIEPGGVTRGELYAIEDDGGDFGISTRERVTEDAGEIQGTRDAPAGERPAETSDRTLSSELSPEKVEAVQGGRDVSPGGRRAEAMASGNVESTPRGGPKPVTGTETFKIEGFTGVRTSEVPAPGKIAARVYRVYPEGVKVSRIKAPGKSLGKALGLVRISQHPDGRWEVGTVEIGKDIRRKKVASRLYDQIEADLGIKLRPSGWLLDDGFKFWSYRNSDAVKHHRFSKSNDFHLSPRQIRIQLAKIKQALVKREYTDLEHFEALTRERDELQSLWDSLPAEVKTKPALSQMFALRSGSDADGAPPPVNSFGFVLRLPFKERWGNPRFNEVDQARTMDRLREIQQMDVKNANWADLVQARNDIDEIIAQLFYYDPAVDLKAGDYNFAADTYLYLQEIRGYADPEGRVSIFSDTDVSPEIRNVVAEGKAAIDHLVKSKRRGVKRLLEFGDEADPRARKASKVDSTAIGETQRSGFFFLAARNLADVPDNLFQHGGQAVIDHLRQSGVKRTEIEHFQLGELAGQKPVTREAFQQRIADRMFDFRRKTSWLNPERSQKDYELGGTRAFRGPRIPGRGVYFERVMAFPKKLKGGEHFAPGNFDSPHWQDILAGTWASWRGSVRDVPDYGKMVVGEEGQVDLIQGARTGRLPRISAKEYLALKQDRARYEGVIDKVSKNIRNIFTETRMDWDARNAFEQDLIPTRNGTEPTVKAWQERVAQLRELAGDNAELMKAVERVEKLRAENEQFFEPGAHKKYAETERTFTPESPLDESYVHTMVRDLLLLAAQKKADSIAISTSETTNRIQINTKASAAHFYDAQLKPVLEKELRRLTGDGSIKLKQIKLPKGIGGPRNEKAYTVWAAKIDPETLAKVRDEGQPMFALRGFYSPAIRAAEHINMKRGTGEQFWKQITKTPGVRKDELDWMGLKEFLADKKAITRDEVLAFMKAHQVELEERVLGKGDRDVIQVAHEQFSEEFSESARNGRGSEALNDWVDDYSRNWRDAYDAKFGENAHQDATPVQIIRETEGQDALDGLANNAWEQYKDSYIERAKEKNEYDAVEEGRDPAKFALYRIPGGENYREFLIRLPSLESYYQSKHFGDQEIVHLRVDDITGLNGERIARLIEAQSDLHQQGNRFGYDTKERQALIKSLADKSAKLEAEYFRLEAEYKSLEADAVWQEKLRIDDEYKKLRSNRNVSPNAPFKGELWLELALKRFLLYAVENGYDAISWSNSKQIAKAVGTEPEKLALQYDQKIPRFLAKYTKKWNGELEEWNQGDSAAGYGNKLLRITSEMRSSIMDGQPLAMRRNQQGEMVAEGKFERDKMLITISRAALDPVNTLHHEAVHALRERGLFRSGEWNILSYTAKVKGWLDAPEVKDYENVYGKPLEDESIIEESIARAHARHVKGTETQTGAIAKIFDRITAYFERVANYLRYREFTTAEDIFRAIEEGDIGARAAPARRTDAMAPGIHAAGAKGSQEGDVRLKGALGTEKALKFLSPSMRLQNSPSRASRAWVAELAETALTYEDHKDWIVTARGGAEMGKPGAVETRVKLYDSNIAAGFKALDDLFVKYRKGAAGRIVGDLTVMSMRDATVGAPEGKMNYRQFREEVSASMRRGDEHDIPEVAEAAKVLRKEVFDPLLQRAIELQLLPEDVTPETAASYLNRIYNKERIIAERPEFQEVIVKWLQETEVHNAQVRGRITSLIEQFDEASQIAKAADKRKKMRARRDLERARSGREIDTETAATKDAADADIMDQQSAIMRDARKQIEDLIDLYQGKSADEAKSALKTRRTTEEGRDVDAKRLASADKAVMKAARQIAAQSEKEAAELVDIASQIIDRILGTPEGRLPYDASMNPTENRSFGGVPMDARGPLAARQFMIPDSRIERWLENDIDHLIRAYVHTMASDVELTARFGSPDMVKQFKQIAEEYAKMADATDDQKVRKRLHNKRDEDFRNLGAIRDRIRGTYAIPTEPDSYHVRIIRGVLTWNYIRMLGGMTISAIPDVSRFIHYHGIMATVGDGIIPLFRNIRKYKVAGDEAKWLSGALEMITDNRAMRMADITDTFGRHSKFERGLQSAGRQFSVVSLMAPWNAVMKQLAGTITQTRILRGAERLVAGKPLKQREIEYFADLGISEGALRQIGEQFKKHGHKESNIWSANTSQWDEGMRPAIDALRVGLRKEVDRIIVTPSYGERPRFASYLFGTMVLQFKSFAISATQKMLVSGLQQRDLRVLNAAILGMALGGLVHILKGKISGHDVEVDWDDEQSVRQFMGDAFDRSGYGGVLMEFNNIAEKVTDGRAGLSALTGKPISRYASRNMVSSLLGPSVGLTEDSFKALHAALGTRDWTQRDTHNVRQLLPYGTLFQTRSIFDKAEQGINDAFGVPEKARARH